MRGDATTTIDRDPDHVWALLADVTRMGEWSPECRRCDWLDGATAAKVGARFKGRNQRGWARWSTTCTITEAEPARALAFKVGDPSAPGAITWRYELAPEGTGTRLTESFDLPKEQGFAERALNRVIGVKDRQADLVAGMETTLSRIKAAAERT